MRIKWLIFVINHEQKCAARGSTYLLRIVIFYLLKAFHDKLRWVRWGRGFFFTLTFSELKRQTKLPWAICCTDINITLIHLVFSHPDKHLIYDITTLFIPDPIWFCIKNISFFFITFSLTYSRLILILRLITGINI